MPAQKRAAAGKKAVGPANLPPGIVCPKNMLRNGEGPRVASYFQCYTPYIISVRRKASQIVTCNTVKPGRSFWQLMMCAHPQEVPPVFDSLAVNQ